MLPIPKDPVVENAATRLETKLDALETKFDVKLDKLEARLDARFKEVDVKFAKVDARLDKMEARFDKVDARFERVDTKFDALIHLMNERHTQIVETISQLKGELKVWALVVGGGGVGLGVGGSMIAHTLHWI